jgi:hypothetical protein
MATTRTRDSARCRNAVTVARPCNSYRDFERQKKGKLPVIQVCASGMDIAPAQALAIEPSH